MILDTALRYVHNCSGTGTKAEFIEEHEPAGEYLWQALVDSGYATENDASRIVLTGAGAQRLRSVS